ncbi:MAG: hypothetical protein IJ211_00965 [Campylobacter sp.]|nr:hypothetical protein [Campylobacter sp.]
MSEQIFKENDEIDIFELLGKIYKGKFIVLGVTLTCFLLGVLYCLVTTPLYKATANVNLPYNYDFSNGVSIFLENPNVIMQKFTENYINVKHSDEAYIKDISYIKMKGNIIYEKFKIDIYGKSDEAIKNLVSYIADEESKKYNPVMDKVINAKKDKIESIDNAIEILNQEKLSLEDSIKTAKDVSLTKINELLEKENNTNSNYASLIIAKDSILNNTLPNLKNKLRDIVIDKIPSLEKEKELLELDLEPSSYGYFEISDLSISQNPVKPKKHLILAIATFLGGILGVFWVLIKSEIAKFRKTAEK